MVTEVRLNLADIKIGAGPTSCSSAGAARQTENQGLIKNWPAFGCEQREVANLNRVVDSVAAAPVRQAPEPTKSAAEPPAPTTIILNIIQQSSSSARTANNSGGSDDDDDDDGRQVKFAEEAPAGLMTPSGERRRSFIVVERDAGAGRWAPEEQRRPAWAKNNICAKFSREVLKVICYLQRKLVNVLFLIITVLD